MTMMTPDETAATLIYAMMTATERHALLGGMYTEEMASEWLSRAGIAAITPGTFDAFEAATHGQNVILTELTRIALASRLA